jgi:hypothetical protein
MFFADEQFVHFNSNSKTLKGCLFKLHGSLVDTEGEDVKKSIITTVNRLSLGLSPPKQKILQSIVKNKTLVFIGYSFSDYFDIMPFLRDLRYSNVIIFKYAQKEIEEVRVFNNFIGLEGNIHVLEGNSLKFLEGFSLPNVCTYNTSKDIPISCNECSDKVYIDDIQTYLNLMPSIFKIKILANIFEVLGYARKCLDVILATGDEYINYNDNYNYLLLLIQMANANTELAKTKTSIKLLKKAKLNVSGLPDLKSKLLYAKIILLMARDYRRQWSFKKAEKLFNHLEEYLSVLKKNEPESILQEEIQNLLFSSYVYHSELHICKSEQLYLPFIRIFKLKIFEWKIRDSLVQAKSIQTLASDIIKNYISDIELTSLLLYKINGKKLSMLFDGQAINYSDESTGYLESENIAGTIMTIVLQAKLDYNNTQKKAATKNLKEALSLAKEIKYPDLIFKSSMILLEILYNENETSESVSILLNSWKTLIFSYSLSKYKFACLIFLTMKSFSTLKLILGLKK